MSEVCTFDAVEVVRARSGQYVHTDALPPDVPAHEIVAVDAATFGAKADAYALLREEAMGMLEHHNTLHPAADCPWVDRLRAALGLRT